MKALKLTTAALICAFAVSSCNLDGCYNCKKCTDPEWEQEICWDDVKDEYDSKDQFKADIELYEAFTGCKCR